MFNCSITSDVAPVRRTVPSARPRQSPPPSRTAPRPPAGASPVRPDPTAPRGSRTRSLFHQCSRVPTSGPRESPLGRDSLHSPGSGAPTPPGARQRVSIVCATFAAALYAASFGFASRPWPDEILMICPPGPNRPAAPARSSRRRCVPAGRSARTAPRLGPRSRSPAPNQQLHRQRQHAAIQCPDFLGQRIHSGRRQGRHDKPPDAPPR